MNRMMIKAPPAKKRRPLAPKYRWRCDLLPHLDIVAYTKGEARAIVKRELGTATWGVKLYRGECLPQSRIPPDATPQPPVD